MMTDFETNYKAYFAMYDGTRKVLGDEEKKLIDALFHDDVSIVDDGKRKHMTKDMLNSLIETLLKAGRKVEVTAFNYLDDTHFEYKMQVSGEDIVPTHDHYIGTIKNNKLYEVKPFDKSSSKLILSQLSIEMAMREFLAIFNGTPREFTKEDEKLLYSFYEDNIRVIAGPTPTSLTKEQWRGFVKATLEAGRKVTDFQFTSVDKSHFEYKTTFVDSEGVKKVDHSIAAYRDGKIYEVAVFNAAKAQKVLFETRFRDYFTLYDGVPKNFDVEEESLFNAVYADEFTFMSGSREMDRDTWKENIIGFIESGAVVELKKFKFLDDIHFEYTLQLHSVNGYQENVFRSSGMISNAKCVLSQAITPTPYETVFKNFKANNKVVSESIKEPSQNFKATEDKENETINA